LGFPTGITLVLLTLNFAPDAKHYLSRMALSFSKLLFFDR
jgi:hypothetical protein